VRAALALAVVLAACGQGAPEDGEPDAAGEADAGGSMPDAGAPDAGMPDAGTPDAGAPDAGTPDAGTPDAGTPDAGTPDAGTPDAGTPDAGLPDGGVAEACPGGMALVPGQRSCIDRWEAALVEDLPDGGSQRWNPYYNPGAKAVRAESSAARQPQGYISGTQSAAACARAGKRLCTLTEWMAACQGPAKRTYPYGTVYVSKECNEGRTPHPVVQYFGTSTGVWDSQHMNDPGINQQANTVADSGAYAKCVTPEGVADMVGNLHEWIADKTFKGGYYVDAKINGNGCYYRTTAHGFDYHDYSTGFRCCRDAF